MMYLTSPIYHITITSTFSQYKKEIFYILVKISLHFYVFKIVSEMINFMCQLGRCFGMRLTLKSVNFG